MLVNSFISGIKKVCFELVEFKSPLPSTSSNENKWCSVA